MSWLYSRALVAEYSAGICSDGEQSAPLSVICTPHQFWHRDKTTDISRLSRYGLTYVVLTADRGEAVLMLFLEDFPVKTSRPLGAERGYQDPDLDSGVRWSASFARWDPDSCSWKTAQCSLLGGLALFSESWPKWGSMRSGVCWERTTSERHTRETGSGYLPTPNARDWKDTGKTQGKRKDINLGTYAARHPLAPQHIPAGQDTLVQNGGKLSPSWVAWVMGWPIGWTDLEPLETDRFREWLSLHSSPSTTD